MAGEYTEKHITSNKLDKDRVQKAPTLFLPDQSAGGSKQVISEFILNSIDELKMCVELGIGSTLNVSYDRKTYECIVSDDGRGIPQGKLLDSYTVLSTSGKFKVGVDSAFNEVGGQWGYGAKLGVYLSKELEVTSTRDGKYLTYKFENGDLKGTFRGKSSEHGTTTKFTIDKKYLSIDELDPDDIEQFLFEESHCYPDLTINWVLKDKGKVVRTKTFHGESLYDLVKRMKPTTSTIHVEDKRKIKILKHLADDDMTNVDITVSAVFAYSEDALDKPTDAMVISVVNSIFTKDGGEHVKGLKEGITKWFKEIALPKMSKKEQELAISSIDMTAGLCGMIRVQFNGPVMEGQHKSRLTSQEARYAVRDAVFDVLKNEKASVTGPMVDFVKRVCKGRLSSKRQRRLDTENAFSASRIEKYVPIIYSTATTCSELIIPEGK